MPFIKDESEYKPVRVANAMIQNSLSFQWEKPEEYGFFDWFAAMFTDNNTAYNLTIAAYDAALGAGESDLSADELFRTVNPDAPYSAGNPFVNIDEKYVPFIDEFIGIGGRGQLARLKSRLDEKIWAQNIIAEHGFFSNLGMGIVAGLFDPINYIPIAGQAGFVAKTGKQAVSISRITARAAIAGATEAAVAEGILQAAQPGRTYEESLYSVPASFFLAGALGHVGARVKAKAVLRHQKQIDDLVNNPDPSFVPPVSGEVPKTAPAVGPAQNVAIPGYSPSVEANAPKARLTNAAASYFAKFSSKLSPGMQLFMSKNPITRSVANWLTASPIALDTAKALDARAEHKLMRQGAVNIRRQWLRMQREWRESLPEGATESSYEAFLNTIGKAWRRMADEYDPVTGEKIEATYIPGSADYNPVVAKAAMLQKEFYEQFEQALTHEGMINVPFVEIVGDGGKKQRVRATKNYLTSRFDPVVLADEKQFNAAVDAISQHIVHQDSILHARKIERIKTEHAAKIKDAEGMAVQLMEKIRIAYAHSIKMRRELAFARKKFQKGKITQQEWDDVILKEKEAVENLKSAGAERQRLLADIVELKKGEYFGKIKRAESENRTEIRKLTDAVKKAKDDLRIFVLKNKEKASEGSAAEKIALKLSYNKMKKELDEFNAKLEELKGITSESIRDKTLESIEFDAEERLYDVRPRIESMLRKIVDNGGSFHNILVKGVHKRSSMLDRTLNVPTSILEPWLIHDAEYLMMKYVRSIGGDLAIIRRTGLGRFIHLFLDPSKGRFESNAPSAEYADVVNKTISETIGENAKEDLLLGIEKADEEVMDKVGKSNAVLDVMRNGLKDEEGKWIIPRRLELVNMLIDPGMSIEEKLRHFATRNRSIVRHFNNGSMDLALDQVATRWNDQAKAPFADVERINKNKNVDLRNLKFARDEIRGLLDMDSDPSTVTNRVLQASRAMTWLTISGKVAISNINDLAVNTMNIGIMNVVRNTLFVAMRNWNESRLARHEINNLLDTTHSLMDLLHQTNFGREFDINEANALQGKTWKDSRTKSEILLQKTASYYSMFNLIAFVHHASNQFTTMSHIGYITRIAEKVAKGVNVLQRDLNYLAELGLTPDILKNIHNQWEAHAHVIDGRRSHVAVKMLEWDEGVRVAMNVALNNAIELNVVKGGKLDRPAIGRFSKTGEFVPFMSPEAERFVYQFRNYIFAANSKVLQRGLQYADARTLSGVIAMTALGMMTVRLKDMADGRQTLDEDKEQGYVQWVARAVKESGTTGLLFDMDAILEQLTNGEIGLGVALGTTSGNRYYTPNKFLGSVLGPNVGNWLTAGSTAAAVLSDLDAKPSDIRSMRSLMWFQNHFALSRLFRAVQDKVSEYVDDEE